MNCAVLPHRGPLLRELNPGAFKQGIKNIKIIMFIIIMIILFFYLFLEKSIFIKSLMNAALVR